MNLIICRQILSLMKEAVTMQRQLAVIQLEQEQSAIFSVIRLTL